MHKAKTRNKAKTKSTRLVELVASFPGARSVCVAGTFNDWHPLVTEMINVGGDRWAKALTLPPGRYEYRFVVDGEWREGSRNRSNGACANRGSFARIARRLPNACPQTSGVSRACGRGGEFGETR